MGPSVLCPSLFCVGRIKRPFLSVTDNGHRIRRYAKRGEIPFRRIGSALAEGEVVLLGSSLVAVSFYLDLHIWIFCQKCGILLQGLGILGTNLIPVKIEIDIFEQTTFKDLSLDSRVFLRHEAFFEFGLCLLRSFLSISCLLLTHRLLCFEAGPFFVCSGLCFRKV